MDHKEFENRLDKVTTELRRILSVEKAGNVVLVNGNSTPHSYGDKFSLAEQVTVATISSIWSVMMLLGMESRDLKDLVLMAQEGQSITLECAQNQVCRFVKESTRDIHFMKEVTSESTIGDAILSTTTIRTVETVKEYHFDVISHWNLRVYSGFGNNDNNSTANSNGQSFTILEHTSHETCIQRSRSNPFPENASANLRASIDQLLKYVDIDTISSTNSPRAIFMIDRNSETCHTPRRNDEIEEIMVACLELYDWCVKIVDVIHTHASCVQALHSGFRRSSHSLDCPHYDKVRDIFAKQEEIYQAFIVSMEPRCVPVAPLLEKRATNARLGEIFTLDEGMTAITSTSYQQPQFSALQVSTLEALMNEFVHQVNEALRRIDAVFSSLPPIPSIDILSAIGASSLTLISKEKMRFLVVLAYLQASVNEYHWSMQHIEDIIRHQLVEAIGKELSVDDFGGYMNNFHFKKFFRNVYHPIPFCHTVRRSGNQSSEGTIKINHATDSASNPNRDCIMTFLSTLRQPKSFCMEFPINATTRVRFKGHRMIHGYMAHKFSTDPQNGAAPSLNLEAEAKQFSCYIVLLGRILSEKVFDPKHALIVHNKDLLTVPLLLETLPTPKAFQDAIESLSPEQQRFTKAYRGMQLESTQFGIAVIQIKPQLERVLGLYPNSLNKEIALTQDLIKLFVEFHISTDLLSYDSTHDIIEASDTSLEGNQRLNQVRRLVQAMKDMIDAQKQEDLNEMRRLAALKVKPPPPTPIPKVGHLPRCTLPRNQNMFCMAVSKFRNVILAMYCTDGSEIPITLMDFILGFPSMEESMIKHPLELVTFVNGSVAWHFMKDHSNLVFFCITVAHYPLRMVYGALRGLMSQFNAKFEEKSLTETKLLGLSIACRAILRSICMKYNEMNANLDTLVVDRIPSFKVILPEDVERELQSLYMFTSDNIEKMAEELQQQAGVFKRNAATVKRKSFLGSMGKMVTQAFGSLGGGTTTAVSHNSTQIMESKSAQPRSKISTTSMSSGRGAALPPQPNIIEAEILMSIDSLLTRGEKLDTIHSYSMDLNSANYCTSKESSNPTAKNEMSPPEPTGGSQDIAPSEHENPQSMTQTFVHSETIVSHEQILSDCTQLPYQLDTAYEKYDCSESLRPTSINVGPSWTKMSQKNLFSKPEKISLNGDDQDKERRTAFNLLDALTKSGAWELENVTLHVIIAATHTFDDSIMNCLVQHNMNPIEKMERSALIMNSVLHNVHPQNIIIEERKALLMSIEEGAKVKFLHKM